MTTKHVIRAFSILLASLATAVAADDTARPVRGGTVTVNSLNIRARPGVQYEVIGRFLQNEKVQALGEMEEWLEVRVPPTAEAWVVARLIDAESKISADRDRVRVHSGPGIVFSTYAYAKKGDVVKRVGDATPDGWQKIEPPAGASAWVGKRFVTLDAGGPALTPMKPNAASSAPEPATVGAKPGEAAPEAGPAAAPENKTAPGTGDQTEAATAAKTGDEPASGTAVAKAPEAALAPPASVPPAVAPVAKPETPVAKPETPVAKPEVPALVIEKPAPPPVVAAAPVAIPGPAVVAEPAAVVPVAPAAPAPVASVQVIREGYVTSLKAQSSATATHLLSKQVGQTLYPVCFLVSKRISLSEWENQNVRVIGQEVTYPGWKRVVLEVTGVQRVVK